jgi:glutathione S-transferase
MVNKPPALLDINPNGTVPSLLVVNNGVEHKIYESNEVMEVFDVIGTGPALYPRNTDGSPDIFRQSMLKNLMAEH